MAVITDIITPTRGSRRRAILLDGEAWRMTTAEVVSACALEVGRMADEDTLASALDSAEPVHARDRAIRMLAYSERTARTVRERLVGDGYPESVAASVVHDLLRVGLIDDARYAYAAARSLSQVRGYGSRRVLTELQARGVGPDLAQEAVAELMPDEAEAEAASRLAASLASRRGATVDRIAARLARKGYPISVALRSARVAMTSLDPEEPGA